MGEVLRDSILMRYGTEGSTLGIFQILAQNAQNDEKAFDLFFTELDAAIAGHPELVKMCEPQLPNDKLEPASWFLEAFSARPAMYLTPVTVGSLRAALDGYSLAAMEEGHLECADLEGFDHRVRNAFGLKGFFRWENAVLTQFLGDQEAAFQWAIKELKTYRAGRADIV